MRLKLSIDLDDLLRDGRVLRIGKWDPNGSFLLFKWTDNASTDDLTFYANHLGWST